MTTRVAAATAVTLVVVLLSAVGLAWLRRRLRVVTVHGTSMAPTLRPGDRILVRAGRAPVPGDLVVFSVTGRAGFDLSLMVKRVAAVAGQAVPPEQGAPGSALRGGATVPPGCLVVAGDHHASQDSRHFGYVPLTAVLGTMVRALPGSRRSSSD